jgi:adenylate kinase
MPVISHTLSAPGLPPGSKLLYLDAAGPLPAELVAGIRSLKIEHVSPESLVHKEICRCTSLGRQADEAGRHGAAVPDRILLAIFRRWFWRRKHDAGFLLQGFPATLLHARVFDEWLEARQEALTGCLGGESRPADPAVREHYRTLGLLWESGPSAAVA